MERYITSLSVEHHFPGKCSFCACVFVLITLNCRPTVFALSVRAMYVCLFCYFQRSPYDVIVIVVAFMSLTNFVGIPNSFVLYLLKFYEYIIHIDILLQNFTWAYLFHREQLACSRYTLPEICLVFANNVFYHAT